MNAEEISNIYKKVSKDHRYGASTFPEVKNVCVELILQRMPGYSIDPDIIDERKAAILNDYFLESVADVKEGYAEKLVSQKELVDSKKKEYYRMSKVKQFFATANFERLKELSKKNELTAQEEKELRRMF